MSNRPFINLSCLCVIALCLASNIFAQTAGDDESYCPVQVNNRWGYVDTKGTLVIKPQFDDAHNFSEGMAGVINGGIRKTGRDGYVFYEGGKFGYIDKTGKIVVPLGKYGFGEKFSEGLAEVRAVGCYGKNCTGFIDKTGRLVIGTQFNSAGAFHHGLAVVEMPNGKYGMIDKTGKLVIPAVYDGLNDISEGVIVANTAVGALPNSIFEEKLPKYKTVFLDDHGNVIAHPEAIAIGSFSDGLVLGTLIVTVGSREVGIEGAIDKTGKWVIEPKFQRVGSFVGGLAPAEIYGKWGFIDRTGKFVVEPVYDRTESFVDGLAEIDLDGKIGFVDTTGKVVIAPRDWTVEKFIDGHSFVRESGFTGYIDKTGKYLWKTKFDK